jgi:L-ascorbate metabolism protein UlaG (beta-lactamase superfamily)
MQYHHIRHATGMLYYADFALLIDPMLSEAKANPPIQQSWNSRRNPLVPLPIKIESLPIPTHCLVTHLHRDHFDIAAEAYLPKQLPLICQPSDASAFSAMGFSTVFQVESTFNIPHTRVTVKRVPGRHGTGAIAERMGISSGYLFKAKGEPTLYITGDTVFYEAVEKTLLDEKPQIIIAFGGAAQFSEGDHITF